MVRIKIVIETLNYKRIVVCLIVILFIAAALLFPVSPTSDFQKYWIAAGDPTQYIKGGFLPLLYSPFVRLGVPPFLAALLVNIAAYLMLATMFPTGKLSALILLLIGISWAAWSPIVNSDIPGAALLATGAILLIRNKPRLACVLLIIGLSMRLQSALVAVFVLMCLLVLSHKYQIPKQIFIVLCISIASAFLIDDALKQQSTQRIEIIKSQRDPIYAGILATTPGEKCGEITPFSKQAMLDEWDKPLLTIISIPPNITSIILCKFGKMATYGASGSYWLGSDRIGVIEGLATHVLKIILVSLLVIYRRNHPIYVAALLVVIGYIGLHAILEIQPRYMIPGLVVSLSLLLSIPKQ